MRGMKSLFSDDLHDGYVTTIETGADEKMAKIRGTNWEGKPWAIRIEGLKRLRANDFLQGNIILDLVVPEASEELRWLRWLYELQEGEETPEYLMADLAGLAAGTLTLLGVTPSYGVVLAALGERIVLEITPDSDKSSDK